MPPGLASCWTPQSDEQFYKIRCEKTPLFEYVTCESLGQQGAACSIILVRLIQPIFFTRDAPDYCPSVAPIIRVRDGAVKVREEKL